MDHGPCGHLYPRLRQEVLASVTASPVPQWAVVDIPILPQIFLTKVAGESNAFVLRKLEELLFILKATQR